MTRSARRQFLTRRPITSSSRPITKPDGLKGGKIRVPVSPLWASMFKAFDRDRGVGRVVDWVLVRTRACST